MKFSVKYFYYKQVYLLTELIKLNKFHLTSLFAGNVLTCESFFYYFYSLILRESLEDDSFSDEDDLPLTKLQAKTSHALKKTPRSSSGPTTTGRSTTEKINCICKRNRCLKT